VKRARENTETVSGKQAEMEADISIELICRMSERPILLYGDSIYRVIC
jgi:hypothetical protein